ncbi:VOC family protein [Variovorax sp. HJSM1_2]|uniref:VOC family protein n=1 Tax=Variovorax sp. HJSM1_2 TaxID=3366263 RepID=UPI003BDC66CB
MPSAPPSITPSDLYPSLTYDDAPAAMAWLCRAFGFSQRFVVPGEGDRVEHSELSLGSSVVMVSSPKAEFRSFSPRKLGGVSQVLSLFVDDPDTHSAVALAAGAEVVRPLQTEEYGARGYMVRDPEGHLWYFGNYRPGAYWGPQ